MLIYSKGLSTRYSLSARIAANTVLYSCTTRKKKKAEEQAAVTPKITYNSRGLLAVTHLTTRLSYASQCFGIARAKFIKGFHRVSVARMAVCSCQAINCFRSKAAI